MFKSTDRFGAAILIVDDQPSNVRLLELVLRRGGYLASTSTTDPFAVCALHRRNHYDLIVLDLQMPGMNGFDVMKALRTFEPHERPAILVMSGDPSQSLRALEAGATSFLSKPFNLPEVLGRIEAILGEIVPRHVERLVAPAA